MKSAIISSCIAGAVLAAGAYAGPDRVVTGATAFRKQTHAGIIAKMGTGWQAWYSDSSGGAVVASTVQATLEGKNFVTYFGTFDGTTDTIIRCSFSGSVEGIATLLGQNPPVGPATPLVPTINADGTTWTSKAPDIGFADCYQDSTDYATFNGYAALREIKSSAGNTPIGVQPFAFVRGKRLDDNYQSADAKALKVNTMNRQIAEAIWATGRIKLGFFTGDVADTTYVNILGRDKNSGTRIVVKSENRYVGDLVQRDSAGSLTVPANQSFDYTSTGTLKTALQSATTVDAIGYLAVADAMTLNYVTANTTEAFLSYNGVPYSAANVKNGLYTLWGYEHLFVTPTADSTTDAVAASIFDGVRQGLDALTQPTAFNPDAADFKCERGGTIDGGLVLPTF